MKLEKKGFFVIIVSIGVLASLAYGIYLAGSPGQERLHRLDEQRLSHIQQISSSIDSFYAQEKRLPSSIDEVRTSRFAYVPSVSDPDTGTPYEYRISSETVYELCAIYSLPTQERPTDYGPSPDFWRHDSGRTCYSFDVRPATELLKPTVLPVR